MPYNYRKLIGKITEIFVTQARFAEAMGLSERTISMKLNGKIGWKQDEIVRAAKLLNIDLEDIPAYFFVIMVQNIERMDGGCTEESV